MKINREISSDAKNARLGFNVYENEDFLRVIEDIATDERITASELCRRALKAYLVENYPRVMIGYF